MTCAWNLAFRTRPRVQFIDFYEFHLKRKLKRLDASIFCYCWVTFCKIRVLALGFFIDFISHAAWGSFLWLFVFKFFGKIELSSGNGAFRPHQMRVLIVCSYEIVVKPSFGDSQTTPMLHGVRFWVSFWASPQDGLWTTFLRSWASKPPHGP